MRKVLIKHPMQASFTERHCNIPNYRETTTKFTRPNKNRRYVKILSHCSGQERCAKELFPGVKHPLMHMVRDMVREGLLDRYTDGRRNYYHTTAKGRDLLCEAYRKQTP